MASQEEGTFHPVGACVLWVSGASQADLSASGANLVVADAADSFDENGPALFDVLDKGQRYRLGKLRGFIGERMEARSFWYGLGYRKGLRIVAQVLPEEEGAGDDAAPRVLVIVEAQCGVFDVREYKKDDRGQKDQRPGRALNALLRYCEAGGLPAACRPFYDAKALKALTKRPLSLKDLGAPKAAASARASTAGKAGATASARKRPASSTSADPVGADTRSSKLPKRTVKK